MKILFKFGDSDFYTTFYKVFELIRDRHEDGMRKIDFTDKQVICDFINQLSWPIYRTFQCRRFPELQERFSSWDDEVDFYTSYFKATPERIFLNEEVDQLLKDFGNTSNGDWFVYDSTQTLAQWKIYSV